MGDWLIVRPLPTFRTTQTQNKYTQTSMPQVGFKSTTPVFQQVKTVHALDCAATWICGLLNIIAKIKPCKV
jgi:hypothetical protein